MKNLLRIFFVLLIIINFVSFIYGIEPLSEGYKDIKLGITQDEAKNILKQSRDFNLKREEILTIRLEPDTEILSTEGFGFINFAYFHFHQDKLFQILLKIDKNRIGYYLLLKKMSTRFGSPSKFSPKRATWQNDKVRIAIEKPCTIKYIYLPIWNNLVKNDLSSDHILDSIREKFVDDL